MTDAELISIQAKRIEEQVLTIREYKEAMRRIYKILFSIGGPLNDNFLRYSRDQLVTFTRIEMALVEDSTGDNDEY